ncbi:hypothetical protein BDC45DRAFT_540684 [Circinella umbellata]|nr:hypothetical protein BDC45DRAFT_540684 [Circinella umbellata]
MTTTKTKTDDQTMSLLILFDSVIMLKLSALVIFVLLLMPFNRQYFLNKKCILMIRVYKVFIFPEKGHDAFSHAYSESVPVFWFLSNEGVKIVSTRDEELVLFLIKKLTKQKIMVASDYATFNSIIEHIIQLKWIDFRSIRIVDSCSNKVYMETFSVE